MSGIMYRIDGNPCSQAAALDFLERIGGIDPADERLEVVLVPA